MNIYVTQIQHGIEEMWGDSCSPPWYHPTQRRLPFLSKAEKMGETLHSYLCHSKGKMINSKSNRGLYHFVGL
jgi:hypothetical protein